jgi:hypothetical protein
MLNIIDSILSLPRELTLSYLFQLVFHATTFDIPPIDAI